MKIHSEFRPLKCGSGVDGGNGFGGRYLRIDHKDKLIKSIEGGGIKIESE